MGLSQRNKGKRGEREAAKLLTMLGLPAQRAQQFDGNLSPDVIVDGHPELYVECKFCDSVSLDAWLAKAEHGATYTSLLIGGERSGEKTVTHRLPVILHRRANKPWKVTMTPEAFVRLVLAGQGESVKPAV